ncbi:unannotated protein [freshwater metagenome]|uniref:Unannotated protein n=1 Tax=freshwater metagenome TaxID=449393 RepID=A0A6J6WT57_9ZZZZ
MRTGRKGRVAPHELEVLGHQENEPEEAEEGSCNRHGTGREGRLAKDTHIEQWLGAAALPQNKTRKEDGRSGKERKGGRTAPAPRRALNDGQHQERDTRATEEETSEVKAAVELALGFGNDQLTRNDGERHDWQVHQEDRAPPKVLNQGATSERTEGHGEP